MNTRKLAAAALIVLVASLAAAAVGPQTATAKPVIKIRHPAEGERDPANTAITVVGSSAPSNATRPNCIVSIQVDGNGYFGVTPQGLPPNQTPYQTWAGILPPQPQGEHQMEAQLVCHNAKGSVVFEKHLTRHFVTYIVPIGPSGEAPTGPPLNATAAASNATTTTTNATEGKSILSNATTSPPLLK